MKTIVLTGVTRGLGRALLEEFALLGHRVIGCSRTRSGIDALRADFPAPHYFEIVDVAEDVQVQSWARHILAEFDPPDLILNNAGLMNPIGPLWSVSADDFRRVVATNLEGIANVTRHFLPSMIRRGSGVMVNFSSGWDARPMRAWPPIARANGASKASRRRFPRRSRRVSASPR